MKYPIIVLTLFIISIQASSAQNQVIPIPVQWEAREGEFTLDESTLLTITNESGTDKLVSYFNDRLSRATGFRLTNRSNFKAPSRIELILDKSIMAGKVEGYQLEVSGNRVTLRANSNAGLFYGIQTIFQLLPTAIESQNPVKGQVWTIPACTISDYPRFAWRGVMLDVSRHYFPKEYVKSYIDQIARFKFNRLHLHLTDDHGWRIEIKSLPKLTSVGAWRVPREGQFGTFELPKPGEAATDGGFYTHEDIREIVQYAKDRFIEILPEIDVPGHSMAAIAAYPELCVTRDTTIKVNPGTAFSKWFGNGKFEMYIDNTLNPTDEKVYAFLDKVFTEVAQLFPFEYIHMGGDECYKGFWERDPGVKAFMQKNNLKTSEELQAYFNNRVGKIIQSKNKKFIGWDEILEGGIAENAAVMSWRGIKGGIEATHKKHFVVMSPNPQYYLDMVQGDASIEPRVYDKARLKEVYQFDMMPAGIDSTFVLGGQGNLWTEQIATTARVEYMTYPRALALSETFWSPKSRKNFASFTSRVESQFERFDKAGVGYAPSMFDPIVEIKKNADGNLVVTLSTEAQNLDVYYTLDGTEPGLSSTKYTQPVVLPKGTKKMQIIAYRGKEKKGRLISLPYEDIVKRVRK